MSTTATRTDVFTVASRNYWWCSTIGGLYFVVGFWLWGGTTAALVSSALFVAGGACGLLLHYRAHFASRTPRLALIVAHLLLGQAVLIWQHLYLPLSDYTHSGDPAARDVLIYLVSALFVCTMSMFGGLWGALVGLAAHYGFAFNLQEEFSFKWVFPVLIASAGIIVSTALWRLDEAYQGLAHLADHDHLTGLLNRSRLTEEFVRLKGVARDTGHTLLLVAWDLDDLKRINDTQGHAAGDAFIASFASALQSSVRHTTDARSGDAAFRVGGDEFLSLHLDATSGDGVVQRVRQMCPAVSAGWARCESLSLDQALTTADAALYADKDRRRLTNREAADRAFARPTGTLARS